MADSPAFSPLPPHTWQRPLGLPWDQVYVVRYASNLDDGPNHGIPLGGLGAGCVGRAPDGQFNLWHLDGGEHQFGEFPACQFSLFEQDQTAPDGPSRRAHALATAPPSDGTLGAWAWYPASTAAQPTGTYHALYPRSWTCYEGVFQAQVRCQQFSPIWPHNYQEASYPVAVFQWQFHNPTDRPLTLSLMVTWENMVGWFTNASASAEVQLRDDGSPYYDYEPPIGQSAGNRNRIVHDEDTLAAVLEGDWLGHNRPPAEGEGQWCVALPAAAETERFYHCRWNPEGDGREVWQPFSQTGALANQTDNAPAAEGERLATALACRFTLAPGETRTLPVVLSWDLPVTEFAQGVQAFRRYTDFFGRDGQQAEAMARQALTAYPTWQQHIEAWQQPILARPDLPGWFKMALFNELYDLASGGTLWSAATDADPVGQFAVLECIDYRWYESLDVRLYGGFATLLLWPELEKAVLRAFARAIPTADDRQRVIGYYFTMGTESPMALRKQRGATPHDLGAPNEQPWVQTNYTSYQDCNQWKDLASDFVLQVYRAYQFTGATDTAFLQDCWEAVVTALQYLKGFDRDGDGIPENEGAPDQTFDDWQLQGISAYCGGLWLAALEAAIAMGETLTATGQGTGNLPILLTQYRRWLDSGRRAYHPKLWTGTHYRLDTGSDSAVIMADQLCGQFFARLLGLPDVAKTTCLPTALDTIYHACFENFNRYVQTHSRPQQQKFAGAQQGSFSAATLGVAIGAANGVLADGSPEDPDSTHQLEVWTGINFGLAALYAQMGQRDRALAICEAVVQQIYTHGLQFRTPEAITPLGTFRACHYMRPMAIWGVYYTLGNET